MDDKVSCWLLENWYKPYFDHPNMLVACSMARFFNLPESLEEVGFPEVWDPERIRDVLRRRMKRGEKVFNGAYIVRGNDGVDKIGGTVNTTLKPLVSDPPWVDEDSMEETWKAIVPGYGFGSFMAGQVVADLRWALSGSWSDRMTWAPLGPGSKRGMNRLIQHPIDQRMDQDGFVELLLWVIKVCEEQLPTSITDRLEAMDYQNCLCEYDKYNRTLIDGKRLKRRYPSD